MYRHHHWEAERARDIVAERQTAGLVGLVVILLLLIGGLFLVRQLHNATVLEDCLLAGHQNCDALLMEQR